MTVLFIVNSLTISTIGPPGSFKLLFLMKKKYFLFSVSFTINVELNLKCQNFAKNLWINFWAIFLKRMEQLLLEIYIFEDNDESIFEICKNNKLFISSKKLFF